LTGEGSFRTVDSEVLLSAGFLTIEMRTIATPSGGEVERIVVMHPGAVAVVPIIGDDVVMIEQYRVAAGTTLLEIPAGKLDDPSHDPLETAGRELAEETGMRAGRLTLLTDLWTSVGFSDERISIYLAEDLVEGTRSPAGVEEEEARVVRVPFPDAIGMVYDGTISDAKTIAGLLLAAARRDPS